MTRRTIAVALLIAIVLLGTAAGVVGWYQTTALTVEQSDDRLEIHAGDEHVETIELTDAQEVATATHDDAELTVVYVADSEVSATALIVVWDLHENGFWHDVELEVTPAETGFASFGEPATTQYSDGWLTSEPDTAEPGSQLHVDYPRGWDHGYTATTTFASTDASNETVAFEARLTGDSLTGDPVELTVPFEVDYDELSG
ncbi:hypothetical protein [Halobiforma nitratireducens]|uniref:Uncharacterized protein n=1 Tax=Halobiforma nitratireducens JCM 10879 TaxID=1227454 RepID=M0MM67_9EURY|nr:hypothetical protein [Halobiforma nitratireducens]EMA46463.1 hypothetical protein C446_01298 [Halobiforma nitratireducens JCM 10879]